MEGFNRNQPKNYIRKLQNGIHLLLLKNISLFYIKLNKTSCFYNIHFNRYNTILHNSIVVLDINLKLICNLFILHTPPPKNK